MKDVLLGETGEGGNRSSWSTLTRAVFHCNEKNVLLLSCCIVTITIRTQSLSQCFFLDPKYLTFRELLLSPAFIKPFISCPCFLPTSQWFRLFVLFGEIMMWYYQWEAERRLEYKTTDWADISSDHVCCCTPLNKQYNMVNQWSDHPGLGFDFVLGENPTHPVICSFLDNSFPTEAHASLYFYGKLL